MYYDHKNMLFLFFAYVFVVYISAIVVAIFLEYPFKTLLKLVIFPPKKIRKLKKDLAKLLHTIDPVLADELDEQDDLKENEITNDYRNNSRKIVHISGINMQN